MGRLRQRLNNFKIDMQAIMQIYNGRQDIYIQSILNLDKIEMKGWLLLKQYVIVYYHLRLFVFLSNFNGII